jgi:effector-binding domain-containing protein
MFRLIVSSIIVLSVTALLVGQATTAPDVSVSPMAVRTLKGCHFLYRSVEADMQSSAAKIEAGMKALASEMKANRIMPAGAPIFVFHNPTDEAGKAFTVELGFPVTADTKAVGESKVRTLEPLKAATVMFSGPPSALREGYVQLYQQIGQAGLEPGTELRQYSLYWEGIDSPNNVMLIQVGLK